MNINKIGPVVLAAALALAPAEAAAQNGTRLALGSDTASWLGVGGQLRLRTEYWDGFAFRQPSDGNWADNFALVRALAHADLRYRGVLRVYLEGKSSLASDRALPGGVRTIDEDVFDLQQLFVDVGANKGAWRLSGRVGRADLLFGRERVVSPLDWVNTRRTFQGASATLKGPALTLTGFWSRPVQVRKQKPNIADSTKQIYGLYATRAWPQQRVTADLYWLRNESRSATVNGTTGPERRHTAGVRALRRAGTRGGADVEVEAAHQWGSLGGQSVSAWMAAAQAGWNFTGARGARLYLGLDYGSGDKTAGGDVNTFNQLYPLGHAYLGFEDVHGRQNVVDVSAGGSIKATRQLSVMLDVHNFHRASSADALYGVDGSVTRPAGAVTSTAVGTEFDLTARHPFFNQRLWLQGGVSDYVPGAFIKDSGSANNVAWVYLQATLAF